MSKRLGKFLPVAVLFWVAAIGLAQDVTIVRGGCPWSFPVLQAIEKSFRQEKNIAGQISIDRWNNTKNIQRFCSGDCHVLYYSEGLSKEEVELIQKRWPVAENQPKKHHIAYGKVAVIVNRKNTINQIDLATIRDLLKMEGVGMRWSKIGGLGSEVTCYGEGRDSTSRRIIRHACMMLGPKYPTGYHLYRKNFEQCRNGEEVLKKVASDRNGIGFVLYHGQQLRGVKMLPISQAQGQPAVNLKRGLFIQGDYPLSESLALYLSPDSNAVARMFCQYATSTLGAGIVEKHGLITLRQHADAVGMERLAEHKAGKGGKVYVAGGKGLKEIAEAVELGFVKEKALLQLRYLSGMGATNVKKFLSTLDKVYTAEKKKATAGSVASTAKFAATPVTYAPKAQYLGALPVAWPRMILLENTIDTQTCGRAASQYIAELKKYKVAPVVVGARSMAVVVNAENKLTGVSKLQLVRLLNGQTKSWNDIKPLFTSGQAKVMIFAVDPKLSKSKASKIAGGVADAPTGGRGAATLSAFAHEVLLGKASRSRFVEYLDSPKAVLAEVASIPNAIGLVPTSELTLNAIPTWNEKARADRKAALAAIKVLAIDGTKPTKKNCLAERPTYVLAKPVPMYTLPNLDKLDKVAAEFAKFVQGPLAAGSFHAEGMITPHSEIHFPSMSGNAKPNGSGMPKWGAKKPGKKPALKKRPGTKPKPGTKPATSPKPGATTKPAGKVGTTDTEGDKPKKKPLKGW